MRIARALMFLATLFAGAHALAQQAILQGGPWQPGHLPQYVGQGNSQPVVQDGGGAGGGALGANLGELGITARSPTNTYPSVNSGTGPHGEHACIYDAPTNNPTGYHYFCMDANAQGGGLLAYGVGGAATAQPFTFIVNGVTYSFPFSIGGIVGPPSSVIGGIALWNNTTGNLLKDSGIVLSSPVASGAKCDGTTVDTTFFNTAISSGSLIQLPAAVTCVVANLVITDNKTLDCNGSVLKAAAGANWVVEKTGFNSHVRNCVIFDPTLALMKTTTLSGIVAPGATTLPVQSVAGFLPNMLVTVQLVSGAYWTSVITSVGANSIIIADAIPSTVSGTPTINAAGTGYAASNECVLYGGVGPPATLTITGVAGALTAVASVNSPGLYTTAPSSPAPVFCPATAAAFGGTLSVSFGGAPSGGFVDASFGAYLVDEANGGTSEDIVIPEAPVGVQVMNSGAIAFDTSNESFDNIKVNAATMVGFAKLVNVNGIDVKGVIVNGFTHHASAYGATGLYINGDNLTLPSGGSNWGILTLGFEIGGLDQSGTLDTFQHGVFDTSRNYGFACIFCTGSSFSTIWATFTGPNASSGVAGKGVGFYLGNSAVNDTIGTFVTASNMTDLHLGDQVSALWVNNLSWASSKVITGFTNSLYPGYKLFEVPTITLSTLASPVYVTPTGTSATQNISLMTGLRGMITSFFATTEIAPGADSYEPQIYINRWTGTGYSGWSSYGSCIYTGTTVGCLYAGPGIPVFPQDKVEFVMAIVGGGSFPVNQAVTAYVNGM